ncbi:F-box/kelch-repeat protein SKIP6 [Elaeis guineensis]|uniref:F-box/kelch-repeat protein SKIP6 n=1 Tax=Elaeis guineensis var. tenera TaxID=51953 RepID=A0A6I9RH92_ELAGV|nr:F-box/kelch-repeat protein SKIP6 [Elaeis guineensis]
MADFADGSPVGPLIPQLPDDLSVRCIARVPRSSHSALALVSRSWRSLLRSPLFVALRSDLGIAQPFLCLNVRTPTAQSCWYLLDPADRQNPILLPAPRLPAVGSACAALGPTIFVLGGSLHGVPSTAVQLFDARLRRWSLGPRMSAAREFAAAGALGGRIYVIGGCLPPADAWAEALDPASAAWSIVPSPPHLREKWMHGSAVLSGRVLAVADRGGVVYDPAAELPWGSVPAALDLGWRGRAAVVGGILYSYDYLGKIRGYDLGADEWKQVEGVERELPKFLCGATLANLGGLLCLVWEGKRRWRSGSKEMEIEWAGIKVSKTDGGGLRGSIVWSESVSLAVPKGSSVAHCVAVEL